MLKLHALTSTALACAALSSVSATAIAQEPDAAELFITNCARCHGDTGDGDGTAELDRPARSFKDGGFSYGNTPKALFRTISIGIPGTPMPGFDTSMSEEERRLVAEYVVTLGPEVREVAVEETILEVTDRPLVVRGMLPAIDAGAVAHPRGVLLGTLSGLTFEYRVDDVRLLGVRQGGFVERTDWTGRGGSALRPLGKVVYLVEGGTPSAFIELMNGEGREPTPLSARLESTWVVEGEVGLVYRLETHATNAGNGDVTRVARVRESVAALGTAFGTGFRRSLSVFDATRKSVLRLRMPASGTVRASFTQGGPLERTWTIIERADGSFECIGIAIPDESSTARKISLVPGERAFAEFVTIVTPTWTDEVKRGLEGVPLL